MRVDELMHWMYTPSHLRSACFSHDFCDRLPLDDGLLPVTARDTIIIVAEIRALHVPQEILVMGDDNQLEVRLLPSCLDDVVERFGQGSDVIPVQVRGRFVKSNKPAVDAETFRQGQTNDDTSQHFLAGAATTTHVHLGVLLDHAHTIVVRTVALEIFTFRTDHDRVHVGTLIRFLPKLLDDAIDLFHLETVILHDGSVGCKKVHNIEGLRDLLVQRTHVSTEIFNGRFCGLYLDV